MYDLRPNMLIGFHGCDQSVAHQLINNPDHVQISTETYDWLGHGFYFWENNYERALDWAAEKKEQGKISTPAVIGAVIQLGQCCDFLDSKFLKLFQSYFQVMEEEYKIAGKALPENKDAQHDKNKDKLIRILDCTAIEFMHNKIDEQVRQDVKDKGFSDFKLFDSTRGVFTEGNAVFKGAGIREKSHIQICIRNLNCIKGFFLPRQAVAFGS